MGFLDQLWDDSLAGPCPATGLGKLRKTTISNSAFAPEGKEALRRLRERRAGLEAQGLNDEAIQVNAEYGHYQASLSSFTLHGESVFPSGLNPSDLAMFSDTTRTRESMAKQ